MPLFFATSARAVAFSSPVFMTYSSRCYGLLTQDQG